MIYIFNYTVSFPPPTRVLQRYFHACRSIFLFSLSKKKNPLPKKDSIYLTRYYLFSVSRSYRKCLGNIARIVLDRKFVRVKYCRGESPVFETRRRRASRRGGSRVSSDGKHADTVPRWSSSGGIFVAVGARTVRTQRIQKEMTVKYDARYAALSSARECRTLS